jgi:CHASE3 domain sensor protein
MLVAMFAVPATFAADTQTQVVSPSDLQNQVVNASKTREQNLKTVQQFLSSDTAVQAIKEAHQDPQQIKNAAASLSNQELAQLATRAQKAQNDFAAGNIGKRGLVIIVLGVLVVILIVVLAA